MKKILGIITFLLVLMVASSAHAAMYMGYWFDEQKAKDNVCLQHEMSWNIAYCGQYSSGGGGGGGNPDTRVQCGFYVVASGGSDSNSGTKSSPFATLAHIQTAMQTAPTLSKVACLIAGSTFSASITLTSADNGETWETDPASPINSAAIDGGSANAAFTGCGIAAVTINGITMQNVKGAGGTHDCSSSQNSALSYINNRINNVVDNNASSASILFNNCVNCTMQGNYATTVAAMGFSLYAFQSGTSLNGTVMQNNVAIGICQTRTDCGVLYTDMNQTNTGGGTVVVSGNFTRDYGSSSTSEFHCGYLDDNASNETYTKNTCGAPTAGSVSTGNAQNTSAFIVHNGLGNKITNNIVDVGNSGAMAIVNWFMDSGSTNGMAGNTFTVNIIVSNTTAANGGNCNGSVGFAYCQDGGSTPPGSDFTISLNAYVNYASGGSTFTNGQTASDASPQLLTQAQLAMTGYLYNIASTSTIFSSPMNFVAVSGVWGPTGFVIPTSTNKSPPG